MKKLKTQMKGKEMTDLKEFEKQYSQMKEWNNNRAEAKKKGLEKFYALREVFKEHKNLNERKLQCQSQFHYGSIQIAG